MEVFLCLDDFSGGFNEGVDFGDSWMDKLVHQIRGGGVPPYPPMNLLLVKSAGGIGNISTSTKESCFLLGGLKNGVAWDLEF